MKFMRTMLALAIACLLLLAAIYFGQDRLLYFPERTSVEAVTNERLRAWPSAQDFRGLVAEPAGTARGTVIVFHGNAGHAGHREFYARSLVPLGLRVILAEYPGFGPRDGVPSQATLVADAGETVALAHRQYGGPLIVIGESLGAAVAAAAGAMHRDRVAGLVLITPWDRLANVAAHHYPWLPVRWLLRDPYDSVARLADFDRTIVVVVAERDQTVPARFGTSLYDTLKGPKHLVVIPAAGHNDWPDHVDARWWRDVIAKIPGMA
jgi:pimeloyl-ACP methyl ester carboxylesterase